MVLQRMRTFRAKSSESHENNEEMGEEITWTMCKGRESGLRLL